MGIYYEEGKVLAQDLLTTLNTAILLSTDWSRPNSGARPNTYKATTTRGAQMVLDLADSAITTRGLIVKFYQSYDGTTLGSATAAKSLRFKHISAGSTATNYVYYTLSLSREHFFLSVEGPRPADANPDSATYGSWKEHIFMGDMEPYFPTTDTTPVVVAFASPDAQGNGSLFSSFSHKAVISRTLGAVPWNMCSLATPSYPMASGSAIIGGHGDAVTRIAAGDANATLLPYLVFDDTDGLRGRLTRFFYLGMNSQGDVNPAISLQAAGSFVTYNNIKYKVLAVNKTHFANSLRSFGPFGCPVNSNESGGAPGNAPLVAVPFAAV